MPRMRSATLPAVCETSCCGATAYSQSVARSSTEAEIACGCTGQYVIVEASISGWSISSPVMFTDRMAHRKVTPSGCASRSRSTAGDHSRTPSGTPTAIAERARRAVPSTSFPSRDAASLNAGSPNSTSMMTGCASRDITTMSGRSCGASGSICRRSETTAPSAWRHAARRRRSASAKASLNVCSCIKPGAPARSGTVSGFRSICAATASARPTPPRSPPRLGLGGAPRLLCPFGRCLRRSRTSGCRRGRRCRRFRRRC